MSRFADLVRSTQRTQRARADFARVWADWKRLAPPISESDAESLAEEAVAWARGQS